MAHPALIKSGHTRLKPGPLPLNGLISVIMPVYREPDLLKHVDALLEQAYPELEVIIVDGEASGASLQPVLAAQSHSPERYARVCCRLAPEKGRGQQLRFGASLAQGAWLLFLHADTVLPAHGLQQISRLLRTGAQAGAFDFAIAAPGWPFRLIEKLSCWRSRLTRLPYGDQGWFISRQLLEELGGFPALPLMEDVALGQALKHKGHKIVFVTTPVLTSARRWQQEGWLLTTLRNWGLLCLYLFGVPAARLVRFYHK